MVACECCGGVEGVTAARCQLCCPAGFLCPLCRACEYCCECDDDYDNEFDEMLGT